MMMATQHLELLHNFEMFRFSKNLLGKFSESQVAEACKRLKDEGLSAEEHSGYPLVQEMLVQDRHFLALYRQLLGMGMVAGAMENMLSAATKQGIDLTTLNAKAILSIWSLPITEINHRLEYYRHFGDRGFEEPYRTVLCQNITAFYSGRHHSALSLDMLTELQRDVLWLPFFASYVHPIRNLTEVMDILAQNTELQALLSLFYEAKIQLTIRNDDWRTLRTVKPGQSELWREVLPLLAPSVRTWGTFFSRWITNGAQTHELQWLKRHLPAMDEEKQIALFATELCYLAGIYGKNLVGLDLETLDEKHTGVLCHAIATRQHTFLQLVRDHYDQFNSIPSASMLFDRGFYTRCKLNSLTLSDILTCHKVPRDKLMLYQLSERIYTFHELHTLAYVPNQYVKIYNLLDIPRVDDKLTVIRQLLKHHLLPADLGEKQMQELASHLSQKPLDRWMREEFAHISQSKRSAVQLLANLDALRRFLPDLRTEEEAAFAVRNQCMLQDVHQWQNAMSQIEARDTDWIELKEKLAFTDEFLSKYQKELRHFLLKEGAELANTYLKNSSVDTEAMRRIVQAEIMGKLRNMKYFDDDLAMELDYPISARQKEIWMRNNSLADGLFRVEEKDDFYTTMQIGEVPMHTCLSYRNGSQNGCLLASFDANKKIMLALRNGIPVARAMLRLTVWSSNIKDNHTTLQFADLQADHRTVRQNELALFLERIYSRGLNDNDQEEIGKLFIDLLQKKAQELGAGLIIGHGTVAKLPEEFVRMQCSLYISRSKAGEQYLDSLGGANSISNEGHFAHGSFYVHLAKAN